MDKYELTNPQKSIWYTEEVIKGTTVNNICASGIIYEKIDETLLKKAIYELIKQHDSYRIHIGMQNGSVYQYISDFKEFPIDIEYIEDSSKLKQIEDSQAKYHFSILDSDLFTFKIVILKDVFACVILTVNHIISDSWSIGISIQELLKIYHSIQNRESTDFENFSYIDYINSEKNYKSSAKYENDKKYWNEIFNTIPEQATIPSMLKNAKELSYVAKRLELSLDKTLVDQINVFCRENHFSVFVFFMAIFSLYTGRVSNTQDFVIGTPILNRLNPKEKRTTGMFVNTVPVRINNFNSLSFIDFTNSISKTMMGILRHQRYSYNSILEDLRSKNSHIPNLYNIMISYQITKAFDESFGNYKTGWTFNGYCANDMNIHIFDFNDTGNLSICYDYLTSKYTLDEIQDLHNRMLHIIDQILDNHKILTDDIEIVTNEEKNNFLYEFNKTKIDFSKDKTIVNLFEEQVEKTPDNVAIIFENQKFTYRELNENVNRLARYLQNMNVKKSDTVSILLNRNVYLITSILAVLKLGACYIPISPEYPQNRINYILDASNSKLLISFKGNETRYDNCLSIDTLDNLSEFESTNLNTPIEPQDLAYIIYTSGSTGAPKGVAISHSSLLNYITWANQFYCNNKPTNFPLYSSIGFDLTVTSIYTPLVCGGSIIIYKENDILLTLNAIFKDSISEIVKLTPAHLELLNELNISDTNVKKLIVGGDLLSNEICNKITKKFNNIKIYNEYGPTEATVGCMIYEYSSSAHQYNSVPIGKPINNTQIYLLDEYLKPVPYGCSGDLYISGNGLSKGYFNNDSLTNKSFIPNPYIDGSLMYKTGDIGMFTKNGDIICLGRSDNQVKIRGFRIELGEIEDKLHELPFIHSCIVIKKSASDFHDFLCAYYTSDNTVNPIEIKKYLEKFLPLYMIPRYFIQLENLPYTTNGKIDRKLLPDPQSTVSEKDIILPRNNLDSKLIELLKSLFTIDSISLDDDFFDIGGDSLSAIKFCSVIQHELNVQLLVRDILENPIIQDLSDLIAKKENCSFDSVISPIPKAEFYPISSGQKRIYLTNQISGKNSILYNVSGGVILDGIIDIQLLEKCINTLINRHESLRTYFEISDDTVVQKVLDKVDFHLDIFKNANYNELNDLFKNFVKPFDLSIAPLFRAKLILFSNNKSVLFVDTHHIISDGTSLSIFTNELCKLYNGEQLSDLKITYKDYATFEKNKISNGLFDESKKYWMKQFNDEIPVLNMPTKYPRPAIQNFEGKKIYSLIDKKTFQKIESISKSLEITPFMLLLSCYYILLSKYTSQDDIIVGTPIVGRDIAETYNIIGMFVNSLALRNKIDSNSSFKDFVLMIKNNVLEAYQYQTYPFDELVNDLHIKRDTSKNPLFDTMFIYQNNGYTPLHLKNVKAEYYIPDTNISKFDFSLEIVPKDSEFSLTFEYCTSLFDEVFMKNFANHYLNILNDVLSNIDIKISRIDMLSEAEKNKILYGFNNTFMDYPKNQNIIQLFENQVKKTPNNCAIVFENKFLTFNELNKKANSLAFYLRNKEQIRANDLVSIMCNRSLEMIIAILAVLKSGGAYVPIDPTYPKDRIDYMLKNSKSKVLLTQKNIARDIDCSNKVLIDLEDNDLYNCCAQNLQPINQPEDLAYVIYTSGSTGVPKGVMIPHRVLTNFTNYCNDNIEYLKNPIYQSIVSITTISFDIFFYETIISLQKGLKVIIANEAEQNTPNLLDDLLNKHEIKILQATPSRMQIFLNNLENMPNLKNLNYVILAGEQVPLALVHTLHNLSNITVYNGYGPSETYYSTLVKMNDNFVTIGKPIYNTQMYILDKNLSPVPIGVSGEIYISGDAVGKGYFNNKGLSDKSFIENPFIPNTIMYKTGDLGIYTEDGDIICLGRSDYQIKIRGLRIELEEIESLVLKYPHIKEAVIVKHIIDSREFLSCYFVADKLITISELRNYLSQSLPRYMIPSYFTALDKLPYTPNGKIDRKSLPLPTDIFHISKEQYIPPQTNLQKQLVSIFEKILNTKPIGIKDNFFELGGDSLLAMNLNIELLKFSKKITYQDIFRYPTIFELEEKITSNSDKPLFNKIENLSDNYVDILKNCIKKQKFKKYNPQNILLTGSTGYLGIHILSEFIKKSRGNIYCIVRNSKGITARKKLHQKLNYYFGNQYDDLIDKRIFAITGDISKPGFGLDQNELLDLANSVDIVINSAANVAHYGSDSDFYKTNVTSVKYIIDFCSNFHKKLYHISTIGVAGSKLDLSYPSFFKKNTVNFDESSLYVGQVLDNVYTHSKFEAESYILNAINQGLDAYLLRMGHLTLRLKDGVFQENALDNELIQKISSFVKLGFIPDYLLNYHFEFTPVDCAAKAIYKILTHPTENNRIFHLFDHHSVVAKKLLNLFIKNGFKIEILSENDFVEKINAILKDDSLKNLLNNLIQDFDKKLHLDYNSDIHIKSDFTIKYLRRTYFKWPKLYNKYLNWFIDIIRKEI